MKFAKASVPGAFVFVAAKNRQPASQLTDCHNHLRFMSGA